MTDHLSAQRLITEGFDGCDDATGYLPTSAILIVSAIDPESSREHLFFRRDTDCGAWKHIGMLQVMLDDLRHQMVDE